MNDKKRDEFWETDLDDLRKQYLPEGMTVADLPFSPPDWRVPVRDVLLAQGRISWRRDSEQYFRRRSKRPWLARIFAALTR